MATPKVASRCPLLEPCAVADVLRAMTNEPITVFECASDKPHLWADFAQGFTVSHSSHDIFTREYPVAVYFKGGAADGLKNARRSLTRAGYECHRFKASGCERPAWLYVT